MKYKIVYFKAVLLKLVGYVAPSRVFSQIKGSQNKPIE